MKEENKYPEAQTVCFAHPWTSSYQVDPHYPFHLVNAEGHHLFIINKTAWTFFMCQEPEQFLQKAVRQGVNVLRVALEGTHHFYALGYDLWPWGGTRQEPDWQNFNEAYWAEVEKRIILAGRYGVGLDIVLYNTLHPDETMIEQQVGYWRRALDRLGKYANVLTWEVANEYVKNEKFQDAAGTYFMMNDPCKRPVCTSNGTTDDAVWPSKPWMGLAINHTCTSSTERHDLKDWYLALALNTRSHGKPAFCNESGREIRHRNDDPVHRRKQAWIWYCSGCYWTLHSWEGCEGINDIGYLAPGQEFFRPIRDFFEAVPFWRLNPNFSVVMVEGEDQVLSVLAEESRSLVVGYICTRASGVQKPPQTAKIRLPDGVYEIKFINPSDNKELGSLQFESKGLGTQFTIELPAFTDDLIVKISMVEKKAISLIEGTL